ncbi:unnamed protein product [Phyllotreta striolata]|uniref:EGF-like domain-containing protein n=1 Tax=Phyllotreta striolata TaxID=444603 RepID=A0A9N9TPE0_PHYSR|nr:unnamed protein product [Phyllotreta striolata]
MPACFDHEYSNSFISPNSANADVEDVVESDIQASIPREIKETEKLQATDYSNEKASTVINNPSRVQRSADPILSQTPIANEFNIFKNVEDALDSNDVELSGRLAGYIQPSKTEEEYASTAAHQRTEQLSGESTGAPLQARSLPLREPHQEVTPSATTTTSFVTQSHPLSNQGRQANPDIQDIITGIVKLLNGNVNVQANTGPVVGRPLRPLSTRINNRGPPRITDVPALPPDFDVPAPLPPPPLGQMPPPAVSTTRLPTPYPFDVPHPNMSPVRPITGSGTSIPISDHTTVKKRPGYLRPQAIPPWKRRRPPNSNNRRPSIPPYKPVPHFSSEMISLTTEKPVEDILMLDLSSQLSSSTEEGMYNQEDEDLRNSTDSPEEDVSGANQESTEVDKELAVFDKNKEKIKNVTKSDKYTSKTTVVTPTFNPDKTEEKTVSKLSNSTSEVLQTNSSIINPTSVTLESISTSILNDSITLNDTSIHTTAASSSTVEYSPIESSIFDLFQTMRADILGEKEAASLSSTATENLPIISTTSNNTIGKTEVIITESSSIRNQSSTSIGSTDIHYKPRPGIVLDDTEYKPGGIHRQPIITRPPIGQIGEIFDITVSAIQGLGGSSGGQGKPYVIPVDIENVHSGDVITSSSGSEGFVSIDGKRTYLNLFDESTSVAAAIKPTGTAAANNQVFATGFAVAESEKINRQGSVTKPNVPRRPIYGRPRPTPPPVRIDTCIVGDDSTCDGSQHEICKTESGVSACHCRPGTARRKHRDPCRKIVSILLSLRVDKIYDRKVVWANELGDQNSDSYQKLSFEAERALESAMSMTPFSDEFLAAKVNSIYRGDRSQGQAGVFVNLTLQLDENADTARPTVRGDIQRHLLGVIQRRSNNVGESALWVDSPPGSISNLQDVDECSSPDLHDCHSLARCVNIFGGFKCECMEGYRDPWMDSKHRAGRLCEQCPAQHCNNRGECFYQNGQEVCKCAGNYYGAQCELDGEVLGVAIGASVAAIIIIGLTLVCLVMWSRRWNREQKAAVGSPVFGYMATASNTAKTPVVGAPPYQLTLEDRLRWAQIADVMAQANHYAPEPGIGCPTRPSSALFGYPSLPMGGNMSLHGHGGTLPPVPLPRLTLQAQMANRAASIASIKHVDNTSSSEEEDKADLLGRHFQVPRPKSRSNASIANQSGIYYDVDYDQHDMYKQSGGIPLSTYSMCRQPFFRN